MTPFRVCPPTRAFGPQQPCFSHHPAMMGAEFPLGLDIVRYRQSGLATAGSGIGEIHRVDDGVRLHRVGYISTRSPCPVHDTGLASVPSGSMLPQAQCVLCEAGFDDNGMPTFNGFGRGPPPVPSHRGEPRPERSERMVDAVAYSCCTAQVAPMAACAQQRTTLSSCPPLDMDNCRVFVWPGSGRGLG